MEWESLLVIPLIFFVGIVIVIFLRKKWKKVVAVIATLVTLFFYSFVFPAPLGYDVKNNKIYFCGTKKENRVKNDLQHFFRKKLKKLDIEFVE